MIIKIYSISSKQSVHPQSYPLCLMLSEEIFYWFTQRRLVESLYHWWRGTSYKTVSSDPYVKNGSREDQRPWSW